MSSTPRLRRIDWRPDGAYPLAIEVLTVDRLRRKASLADLTRPENVQFFVLIGVTRGRTNHRIDFETIDARTRTWIVQRAGQTQQ